MARIVRLVPVPISGLRILVNVIGRMFAVEVSVLAEGETVASEVADPVLGVSERPKVMPVLIDALVLDSDASLKSVAAGVELVEDAEIAIDGTIPVNMRLNAGEARSDVKGVELDKCVGLGAALEFTDIVVAVDADVDETELETPVLVGAKSEDEAGKPDVDDAVNAAAAEVIGILLVEANVDDDRGSDAEIVLDTSVMAELET